MVNPIFMDSGTGSEQTGDGREHKPFAWSALELAKSVQAPILSDMFAFFSKMNRKKEFMK